MALMEYCLVNIVLGDTALPKPIPLPTPPKVEVKEFSMPKDYAPPKVNIIGYFKIYYYIYTYI